MTDVLLETDSRGRVTVGRLSESRRFLAHVEPDGSIVLTPAVVMPVHQAALLERPDVVAAIREGRANKSALRTRALPAIDG